MGNCISSQSQAGALEKQTAGSRGAGLVAMRKAAMEKYPVPNKCRVIPDHEESNIQKSSSTVPGVEVAQLRSRLRPPSVSASKFNGRPLSVQLNSTTRPLSNGTDSNGNIPRPSSLPRLIKTAEPNVAAKIESLLGRTGKPTANNTGRPELTRLLMSSSRTIINPPPVKSSSASNSPSPSGRSFASSLDSNRSGLSVTDSGIATSSSRSSSTNSEPTNNKNSPALPVSNKFGFQPVARKPSSAVERMNYVNSAASSTGAKSAPAYQSKSSRPSPLRIPSPSVKATSNKVGNSQPSGVRQAPSPQLAQIKSRAAQVLAAATRRSHQQPSPLAPRLSVEAIVASLEQEMRHQLGPEPPPLVAVKEEPADLPAVDVVERFLTEPADAAEVTFLESGESGGDEEEDFIEDIELQLQTPSTSISDCQNCSPRERSRDEGHPTCDEEDSAATSISDDAMIDDEIADQPGLVMLGQSASVPASPLRAWRSELFQYHLAGSRDYVPSYYDVVHSAQHSEEDPNSDSATSATSPGRRVRSVRRVASVSDIDGSLRSGSSTAAAAAMRAELYGGKGGCWPLSSKSVVPIELEEYAAMTSELADIKAQLLALQSVLMESDGALPDSNGSSPSVAAPLWDLKRDLVLLREELQEKNTTIRSLRNELKAAGCRATVSRSTGALHHQQQPSTCCNVATQTDRLRSVLSNGVSPTENGSEEGPLMVSTNNRVTKLPVRTSSQDRQTPVRLTALPKK